MIGGKARRFTLLPSVTLEEVVPADHFYRHLDRVLDLSFVPDLVQNCYAAGMGRPSVDPVVFFKLQLVMFFEGIRSERQLLRVAADRLSVRWYLGYNLDEAMPDHSSLTRIRARYGLEVFRRFFEAIVEQCQQAGLIWGKELYFDATQVQADAALDSLTARFAVEARQQARTARQAEGPYAHGKSAEGVQERQQVLEAWRPILLRFSPHVAWSPTIARALLSLRPLPCQPLCRFISQTRYGRRWRRPRPPAMTGSLKRAGSCAGCAASTSPPPIAASARLTPTPPPCGSKAAPLTRATKRIISSMAGGSASLWGYWWPRARSWRISPCSICSGACASAGRCGHGR